MHGAAHSDESKLELPTGYGLEADGNNRLLKRPNGSLVAAFTEGVPLDSILLVAEADSETVLLFSEDVKEARSEFLMTLEAVFRR
jgi:hypothetical protein